jgi:hypothetical protein
MVLSLAIGIGLGWARRADPARSADQPPGGAAGTTGPAPTVTEEDPDAPGTAPTTRRPSGGLRIIQWIRDFGPLGGGADGPADEAFLAMIEGRCADALQLAVRPSEGAIPEPGRTLYEGAGSACLAAFEHQPVLWPRAEAALERVAKQAARLDCEQQTVYRLLRKLVELHRADPTARLVKRVAGGHGTLACPRITKLTPDHGPVEGGYAIQVEGVNLPRVVRINWGFEHHLTAESTDGRHAVINAPPASGRDEEDLEVWVWPDGWPWPTKYNAVFHYDRPSPTTTSSTTTTSTTAAPPPSSG